jgi:hypothetical protein
LPYQDEEDLMDTLTKLRVCLAARGKIPTRTQIPLDLETLFVAFAQHPKRHAQYDECGVQATLNYLTTAAEHTYPRTESRARALLRSMVDWLLRRVHGPKNKPNPEFLFALRDIEATPVRLPGLVSAIAALPDPGEGAVLEYQLRARAMHVCAKRLEIAHEGSVLDQEAQVGFAAEALLAVLPLDRLLSTLRRAAAAHHATYAADDEDEEDSEESTEDEPGLLAETCGRSYRLHAPEANCEDFSVQGVVVDAVLHGGYPWTFDCILRWPLQNKFRKLGPPNLRYSTQKGPVLRWEHDVFPRR